MLKRFNFFTNGECIITYPSSQTPNRSALDHVPSITSVSGGGSHFLLVGDSAGMLMCVNRNLHVSLKKQCHAKHVNLVHQLKTQPIAITIGDAPQPTEEDSGGSSSTMDTEIKIWRVSCDDDNVNNVAGVRAEDMARLVLLRSFTLAQVLGKEKGKPYWAGDGTREAHFIWPAVTCVDVTEDLMQMAIGFSDGHVLLIRSDPFLGEGSSKGLCGEKGHLYTTLQTFKHIGKTKVTGVGFSKRIDESIWLWVATENNLRSYKTNNVLHAGQRSSFGTRMSKIGEVEPGPELDTEGCPMHCCCVAVPPVSNPNLQQMMSFSTYLDGPQLEEAVVSPTRRRNTKRKAQFVLGKFDRVEYFSPEDPGSVYAVMGEKKHLAWFRNYLVVVTNGSSNLPIGSEAPTAQPTRGERKDVLQLYDFKNKFIALSFSLRGEGIGHVTHLARQWNKLFVFTSTKRVFMLREKDTQTKLHDLFKRNLYATAISLANSSRCDQAQIMEIYKMYGDHLYAKGSYDDAVTQYCRTIGHIEPSYVIRRFLDSQRIENLTTYLEMLHTHPNIVPSGDHTTLLLNCYTKQKSETKLESFIGNKNITREIDVEAAVAVLRSAHYFDQALQLAKEHDEHALYLQIMLEEIGRQEDALTYLCELAFSESQKYLKEYGKSLMDSLPNETTAAIEKLCCHSETWSGGKGATEDANPEEFIHIFVDHPDHLKNFLGCVVDSDGCRKASPLIWNTYLELLLLQTTEKHQPDTTKREEAEQQVMGILKNPAAMYDANHALVLVQSSGFKRGQLYLYERMHMYHMLIRHYMETGENSAVLSKCKAYGGKDPNLWVQVLMYFAQEQDGTAEREIQEVLHHIERLRILPPLLVIEILSSNENINLSTARPYIMSQLGSSQRLIDEHSSAIHHLRKDTENMKREIHELRTQAKVFTSTKCNLTGAPLELPTVHFLSGNSYNLSSLPGGGAASDSAAVATAKTNGPAPSTRLLEDPKCSQEQQSVADIMQKLQQNAKTVDEEFFNQLEISNDGFATVAEYFSKCLFETDSPAFAPPTTRNSPSAALEYIPSKIPTSAVETSPEKHTNPFL